MFRSGLSAGEVKPTVATSLGDSIARQRVLGHHRNQPL